MSATANVPPPVRDSSLFGSADTRMQREPDPEDVAAFRDYVTETSRLRLLVLAVAFVIIFTGALITDSLFVPPGPELDTIQTWLPIQIAIAFAAGLLLRYVGFARRHPVVVTGVLFALTSAVGAYLLGGLGGFDGPFFYGVYLVPTFVTLLPCDLWRRTYASAMLVIPFVLAFVLPYPQHLDYPLLHIPVVYVATSISINLVLGHVSYVSLRERFMLARELDRQRASLAEHNDALAAEVERQIAGGEQLLSRLAQTKQEREGLARSLHDDVGQLIVGARMELKALERALGPEAATPEELEYLRGIVDSLEQASRKVMVDLRGATAGDQHGDRSEADALEQRVRGLLEVAVRHGLTTELRYTLDETCLAAKTDILFRAVQESITNVLKHADARSLHIEMRAERGAAVVEIADDGLGFDPARLSEERDDRARLGLHGLRERFEAAGGSVRVESAPRDRGGSGTTVRAEVPVRFAPVHEDNAG